MRPATQTSFENPSRSRSDVSGLRPVGRDARDAAPYRCCEFKILTTTSLLGALHGWRAGKRPHTLRELTQTLSRGPSVRAGL